jgi:hypothetical protein
MAIIDKRDEVEGVCLGVGAVGLYGRLGDAQSVLRGSIAPLRLLGLQRPKIELQSTPTRSPTGAVSRPSHIIIKSEKCRCGVVRRDERCTRAGAEIPANGALWCVRVSAPERIQTSDLRFRRPTLYPAELLAQWRLV